jgi:biotin operon repressor
MRAAVEGWCQQDIAKELGVSGAAVSLRLKSLREKGVKVPNFKGWYHENEKPVERLKAMMK